MNDKTDIVLTRIRKVRHQISEHYAHNPQRLIDYYLELQQEFTTRLLADEPGEPAEAKPQVVAPLNPTTALS